MTVGELIEALSDLPEDLPVITEDEDRGERYVETVERVESIEAWFTFQGRYAKREGVRLS